MAKRPAMFWKVAGDVGYRVVWDLGAGMTGQSGVYFSRANAEKKAQNLRRRGAKHNVRVVQVTRS